jgi:hypothetical protein
MKWGFFAKLFTTVLGAAVAGAAGQFATTGDVKNWQGYAVAGGVSALTAGAALFVKPPVMPATAQAAAEDPKAQVVSQVSAALDAAAQRAIVDYGTKLLSQGTITGDGGFIPKQ